LVSPFLVKPSFFREPALSLQAICEMDFIIRMKESYINGG